MGKSNTISNITEWLREPREERRVELSFNYTTRFSCVLVSGDTRPEHYDDTRIIVWASAESIGVAFQEARVKRDVVIQERHSRRTALAELIAYDQELGI